MSELKLNPCLTYGIRHSKKYKPSVVAPCCSDTAEDGTFLKLHSDGYLLRHQKNLEKKIGLDSVRRYLDQMQREPVQLSHNDLSDDELFSLIEPAAVDNLTTAWEYANYLQKNHATIKSKYDEMMEKHRRMESWRKRYGVSNDDEFFGESKS